MKHLACLALASVALAGCGGSSLPPTNARNEADWTEAIQKARVSIEPEEALLGVTKAREHERELAKSYYNALVAEEHETPAEREEAEKGQEPLG